MEGLAPPDETGPVRAVGVFGHDVVAGVADRAGRRQHAIFHHPGGVHRAGVPHAMIAVVGEAVGPAARRGPGDRLLQRLQGAAPPCSWWWRTPGPRSAWRTCR